MPSCLRVVVKLYYPFPIIPPEKGHKVSLQHFSVTSVQITTVCHAKRKIIQFVS